MNGTSSDPNEPTGTCSSPSTLETTRSSSDQPPDSVTGLNTDTSSQVYELHKQQLPLNTYLDNLLIGQKDKLINRIDNARNKDDLRAALITLTILSPLWHTCNYEYKESELRERINKKLASFRSNSST